MTTETNIDGALAAALAKAQGEFPPISRDKEVTVQTKTGGSYKFKYAPLDTILNAVRKPLADNGLAVVQLLDDGDLVTMLMHESGARLAGRVSLPAVEGVQALGSAITYLRRYSIQAILGIAAEEDDDGNQASGNSATFGGPQKSTAPDVETEALIGDFQRATATVRRRDAKTPIDALQGPDGHVIVLRLEMGADDKAIPQVVIQGDAGEALYLATSTKPDSLVGKNLSVKGRLYHVTRPGKQAYNRLHVSEWKTDDYQYPAADEPVLPGPPDDVPLVGESASAPLFDDMAVAS
jgi:hypothetical protein